MPSLRTTMFFIIVIGCGLVFAGGLGLALLPILRSSKNIFGSEALIAAWIGFSGSLLGALLTISVAAVALWPTYQQLQEARRASAVSTGEALRSRFKLVQEEMGTMFLDFPLHTNSAALQLEAEDVDRETWIQRHPEKAQTIREILLPTLGVIASKLFQGLSGPDLPEVDRQIYFKASADWQNMLYTVLDGEQRGVNGERGPVMNGPDWRAHVSRTKAFLDAELQQAKFKFGNSLNLAQQALRFEIVKWDKIAIGSDSDAALRRVQHLFDQNPPAP